MNPFDVPKKFTTQQIDIMIALYNQEERENERQERIAEQKAKRGL